MENFLSSLYEKHHSMYRKEDFSILKKERGDILKKNIGINKKILDIGCRDGSLTSFFADNNQVIGVDVDGEALKRAKSKLGIETLLFDIQSDPWPEILSSSFDVVVAGEILEHLYYPEEIVKKISNKLISGGVFLGSVPNAFSLKNRLRYLMGIKKNTPLEDPTHINHFSYKELKNILSSYFKDVKIIGLGRYEKMSKRMPGLIAFNLFFIAKK